MSEPLVTLLTDPWAYGIFGSLIAAISGFLALYVRRRIAAGVDHRFALRLEDHKQELRLTAESARYNLEERLSRKTLYISKGHEAAVELYHAVRVAHGHCMNLRGLSHGLTFDEFNADDLAEYMKARDVLKGKQEEILNIFSSDRSRAIQEMKTYVRMLDVQYAARKLGEAKNISYLNELYFDDDIIDALNLLFARLDEWMFEFHFPPGPREKRKSPTREQITDALERLHGLLRKRLSGPEGGAFLTESPVE